jgi:transposase
LNGILWVLRSGARWKDLPPKYGWTLELNWTEPGISGWQFRPGQKGAEDIAYGQPELLEGRAKSRVVRQLAEIGNQV